MVSDPYPADWVKRRRMVIKRDGGICLECGHEPEPDDGISLHAHHVKPISEGGGHSLDNLITLCENCHINTHTEGPPHPSRVEMSDCTWCEREYPIASSGYGSFCSAVCMGRYKVEGVINQIETDRRICAACYSRVQRHHDGCPNCDNWDVNQPNKSLVDSEDMKPRDLLTFAWLNWQGHNGF